MDNKEKKQWKFNQKTGFDIFIIITVVFFARAHNFYDKYVESWIPVIAGVFVTIIFYALLTGFAALVMKRYRKNWISNLKFVTIALEIIRIINIYIY